MNVNTVKLLVLGVVILVLSACVGDRDEENQATDSLGSAETGEPVDPASGGAGDPLADEQVEAGESDDPTEPEEETTDTADDPTEPEEETTDATDDPTEPEEETTDATDDPTEPEEETTDDGTATRSAMVYTFESGPEGWVTGTDEAECPDAEISVEAGAGRGGTQALAWTMPEPFDRRCVIGVNVADFPPSPWEGSGLDRGALQVQCWIRVPPEMRDGSSAIESREYFGFWMYDEEFQAHFGDDTVADSNSDEWIALEMLPGQANYQTIEGSAAERHPQFGELGFLRVWARSNSAVDLSSPIYIDDCSIESSVG